MDYGMYVSAAGALANRYRQDVIANNLANAETVSFKRDLALLQSRATEAADGGDRSQSHPLLERIGGGLFALPSYTDFRPAGLEQTDHPLDLALNGEGFFAVQGTDGVRYTRDGRLAVNDANQLVTRTGRFPVLDTKQKPITIDRSRLDALIVAPDGSVSQNETVAGQLGVFSFDDITALRKEGDNLYRWDGQARGQLTPTPVQQGALEQSGVQAIDELTDLIQNQRHFEQNIQMMRLQDQVLGLAVQRLAALN